MRVPIFAFASLLALDFVALSQPQKVPESFQVYLTKDFDYVSFSRFDAPAPPKKGIYQSNGFLALTEQGFGGQVVVIPAPVDEAPGNISDRLLGMEIDASLFVVS